MKGDYENAGVPMLTVTHGRSATRKQVLWYSIGLVPVAVAAAASGIGGPLTMALSLGLTGWFVWQAWLISRRDDVQGEADGFATERRFFRFSLYYLFALFASFLAERALAPLGLGGW
jgi:protoheme IX farnesyltransferase